MICVRYGVRPDLPTVMAIERQSFVNPWGHRGFSECLKRKSTRCIVAEDLDDEIPCQEIPGFPGLADPTRSYPVIGFSIIDHQKSGIWIVSVGVEVSSRRCGVGSALLDYILMNAETGQAAFVMVGERDDAAAQFFVHNGFLAVGVCDDWFGNPETSPSAYMLQKVKGEIHAPCNQWRGGTDCA